MTSEVIRSDHRIILELVESRSTVLDLGCGTGELLYLLISEKSVRGQGLEIDAQAIYTCVARGVNVLHGDIDIGLAEYNDKSFDYTILNQSLQQLRNVEAVFKDALRVGKKVIVGFPNFAFYKARLQFCFQGKAPVTGGLPYQWYETPNLHFLSISDFIDYCHTHKITIERSIFINEGKCISFLPNLFAQIGIFVVSA